MTKFSWPMVSRPTDMGGLGFGFKWNMGWMHDILEYMKREPVHRKHHQNELTFSWIYAFTENFILPFSHDEVVHGKGSLIKNMPGDRWQKFANLRLLYAFMTAHPGKVLHFMGGEFAQLREWNHKQSLDWHLLENESHSGIQRMVKDLNHLTKAEKALHELDFDPAGFKWINGGDANNSVLTFIRQGKRKNDFLIILVNFTPVVRRNYKIGVPAYGNYKEIFNSDWSGYDGSNVFNGTLEAEKKKYFGFPNTLTVTAPPLACIILKPEHK